MIQKPNCYWNFVIEKAKLKLLSQKILAQYKNIYWQNKISFMALILS